MINLNSVTFTFFSYVTHVSVHVSEIIIKLCLLLTKLCWSHYVLLPQINQNLITLQFAETSFFSDKWLIYFCNQMNDDLIVVELDYYIFHCILNKVKKLIKYKYHEKCIFKDLYWWKILKWIVIYLHSSHLIEKGINS